MDQLHCYTPHLEGNVLLIQVCSMYSCKHGRGKVADPRTNRNDQKESAINESKPTVFKKHEYKL